MNAVACPTPTQCTAVDQHGREITFNPNSAAGATSATIGSDNYTMAVSCPSASLCVATDNGNEADNPFNDPLPRRVLRKRSARRSTSWATS